MLPNPALEPERAKLVWLYVYNTFDESPADRAATRIRLRFGVTSWPQLLLVDPTTLQVIGTTGRSVASFQAAVARARIAAVDATANARLTRAEALAARIGAGDAASLQLARQHLLHDDIVVQTRALERLVDKAPDTVVARAAALLTTPSDPLRYAVCKALEQSDAPLPPEAVAALERLARAPEPSRNPNVLRIHAVRALGVRGRASSTAVVAPFAATGNYRNGLTRVALRATRALAQRYPETRAEAAATLARGFPTPAQPGARTMARLCTRLARDLHAALVGLTGREVPFPSTYDAATKGQLERAFGRSPGDDE